jgi:oligosaccharide repeat unit polymerase
MYHPVTVYSLFHFIAFVIRPILAYWLKYDVSLYETYRFHPTDDQKALALLVSTFGYAVFTFSCLRAGPSKVHFFPAEKLNFERKGLINSFILIFIIVLPLAIYSINSSYTYDSEMFLNMRTGHALNTKSSGYLSDAQFLAIPLSVMFAWFYRYRFFSLIPAFAFVLLRAGTGGRGPFIICLMALGLTYAYTRRIRVPNIKVIAIVLCALVLFRFVGDDRGASLRQLFFQSDYNEKVIASASANVPLRTLESMDYANDVFLQYLVWVVPEQSGTYDYFLDNLEVFVAPVPRMIWPGKPDGSPIVRVRFFEYGFPIGMTRSLPGEGWFALGWFGVFIWCYLAGYILGRIYEGFASGKQSFLRTFAYLCFFPSLIITFRDGQTVSTVKQAFWYLSPFIIWWFVARVALKIPTYEDFLLTMRKMAKRKEVASGEALSLAAAKLQQLPPAVRRRRLAMALKEQ